MRACPECGWSETLADPAPGVDLPTKDVARVTTVAEAGYLVSLLEAAGVSAEARPVETFNAVTGGWTHAYAIAAPAESVAVAADVLAAESDDAFSGVAARVFDRGEDDPPGRSVNPWRMLTVLAVVAAAGSTVAIDTLAGRRPQRADRQADELQRAEIETFEALFDTLRKDPSPLRSEGRPGGARRVLRHDRATDTLVLAVDNDRDGRYETLRRFSAAAPLR